jgi:dimethylglycine dehydrogenase
VAYEKPRFVGRDAALRERESPPAMRLVALRVEAEDADAAGYEPVWLDSRQIGFTTSGAYGHCAGTSLAMAYLKTEIVADRPRGLSVTILGDNRPCSVLDRPIIDPDGVRMRG